MNSSITSMLHLHGLPPLPRSLSGYVQNQQPMQMHGSPQNFPSHPQQFLNKSGHGIGRPAPIPPPRPHSRRSSSSGSSFRASPEHVSARSVISASEGLRSSPRSLSSSPHSLSYGFRLGRSSADSFSEPRAFVRVVKSYGRDTNQPATDSNLDVQLAQLKKDMQHLRQQDMALLGHLLQIHQGIQDLKNALVPPPQPAPSMPMFHSTPPSYGQGSLYSNPPPPRHARKMHPSPISRGAKLFAKRAADAELGGAVGTSHPEMDEDSDSASSLEYGGI
ncbi:Protein FAM89A [Orchesella cincta]|uniref:Protein FAM89A n=1 Tax=Orchesella cincta TaxID=48709 RepID=A0A1D2MDB3_ORCCI|nr:Protein FAM89A [Orchesella cincta]